MNYTIVARTIKGNVRKNNQDNFFCNGVYKEFSEEDSFDCIAKVNGDEPLLLAVFDGMGGMEAGEKAAWIASHSLYKYGWMEREAVGNSIRFMNNAICGENDRQGITMGSTCVILENGKEGIRCQNVGDSRAYVLRSDSLTQLSKDHVEEGPIFLSGSICGNERKNKASRSHVLSQFLGIDEREFIIEPYVSEWIKPKRGDIFLLCSDGLYGMVNDDRIAEIIKESEDIAVAARRLEDEALREGGVDNITTMLLSVSDE